MLVYIMSRSLERFDLTLPLDLQQYFLRFLFFHDHSYSDFFLQLLDALLVLHGEKSKNIVAMIEDNSSIH